MFNFTDPILNELASQKMSFENWQEFEKALSARTSTLACYKPVKFKNKEEFDKSMGTITLSGEIKREGDLVEVLLNSLSLMVKALEKGGNVSIYDFIETFPHLVLN